MSERVLKPIKVSLSEKELNIILSSSSDNQLIIGRSGTGKTTTAMLKLAAMYLSF